jgi:hypothetical protein
VQPAGVPIVFSYSGKKDVAMDKTRAKDQNKSVKSEDEKLDDALDDTFPASDPPAMTEPYRHVGSTPAKGEKKK